MYYSYYKSPLCRMIMTSDGENLTGLWFEKQKYRATEVKDEVRDDDIPVFENTRLWLAIYFAGNCPDFVPPIKFNGSEFQNNVWNILKDIPFGKTMTYGEVAESLCKRLGLRRMSAQAIGNAVSHNPIAIIIPCHRVVGANGKLVGYAAGTDKKQWLLNNEGFRF